MPVGSIEASLRYKMDGEKTVFDYNFHADRPQDVQVLIDDGVTTSGLTYVSDGSPSVETEYSVVINSSRTGGQITVGSAYSSDYDLVVYRFVDYLQEETFEPYEEFNAEAFENVADKATMQMQQIRARIEEQNT